MSYKLHSSLVYRENTLLKIVEEVKRILLLKNRVAVKSAIRSMPGYARSFGLKGNTDNYDDDDDADDDDDDDDSNNDVNNIVLLFI